MKTKLKITGQKELLKKLAAFGEEAERTISSVTQSVAGNIALKASQNAPIEAPGLDSNELAKSINVEPRESGKMFYQVAVNALPMGAYMEFGTGAFVDVKPGWESTAWAFYKNGKGTLHPKPFLYPAWREGKDEYKESLNALLKNLTNKFNR